MLFSIVLSLASATLLCDFLPGNSLPQEIVSNLRLYLFVLVPLLSVLSRVMPNSRKIRNVFYLFAFTWTINLGLVYWPRQSTVSFTAEQVARYSSCLQKMSRKPATDLSEHVEGQSDAVIARSHDNISFLVTADVWDKKSFFLRSLELRRFAKSIRHDEKPFIVVWESPPSIFARQVGGMLFQARLNVAGYVGSNLLLTRDPSSVISELDKLCL